MDQVEVKITGQAITARYGTLSTGDTLVTDAAFAKHLVEDCGAAEYVTKAPATAPPKQKATAVAKQTSAKIKAAVPGNDGGTTPPVGSAPTENTGVAPLVAPEATGDVQTSAQSTDGQ